MSKKRGYEGVPIPRGEIDYGGARRSDVARELGITRARVGQIERQALGKLHKALNKEKKP